MMRVLEASLCAALLSSCAAGSGTPSSTGTTPSASASDFRLQGINGEHVRLSDYLGKKVVVLNFWATWCSPCQGELPHLERMYQKYKDDVVVLAVSMDGPESIANVPAVARRLGVTFPVLLDEETRVVGMYNPTRAAPHNVIIDRKGSVAFTKEGYHSGDEKLIEDAVQRMVEN
jgi:peroxiredoxin